MQVVRFHLKRAGDNQNVCCDADVSYKVYHFACKTRAIASFVEKYEKVSFSTRLYVLGQRSA
jgi:hypothetical protein